MMALNLLTISAQACPRGSLSVLTVAEKPEKDYCVIYEGSLAMDPGGSYSMCQTVSTPPSSGHSAG